MTQKLIKFGFDFCSELLLDEILQALKFCPVQYNIEQISEQHYFLKSMNRKKSYLYLILLMIFICEENSMQR